MRRMGVPNRSTPTPKIDWIAAVIATEIRMSSAMLPRRAWAADDARARRIRSSETNAALGRAARLASSGPGPRPALAPRPDRCQGAVVVAGADELAGR